MEFFRVMMSKYINNILYGWIRSVVPWVVGLLATYLLRHNITISVSEEQFEAIFAAVALAITSIYYWMVRLLARRWPNLEWLLGLPKPPVYAPMVVQPDMGRVDDTKSTTRPDSEGA